MALSAEMATGDIGFAVVELGVPYAEPSLNRAPSPAPTQRALQARRHTKSAALCA
jgi:hypothetical protein